LERILIADASRRARRALRGPLEAAGFAVEEAGDAQEALTVLDGPPHHVALVDLELPGGALGLLDALKTDPDLAGTSVVLTGDAAAGAAVGEGLERGAIDFLQKTAARVEVVARTRAALRIWELQHTLRRGNRRLTELAATDDLTGLLARRFLESHLRGLVAAASRHGRPLSVVMIDLDNFKEINDTHGHQVGDEVLLAVVERMRSRLRAEDLLGRWGGDELMLVLPDIELEGAVAAADGVRRTIADTDLSVDGKRLPISISAGAAAWHGDSAAALIGRADSALYQAKAAGRNRVHGDRLERAA
jgi:two-component system, cell cycle response regulator